MAGQICKIMCIIFFFKCFHTSNYWFSPVCKYLGQVDQFANLPQSTCPNWSNFNYLHQTHQCASGMCYKRRFLESYSLYACTYVAGVRDISSILCYHQVLFAAVTKLEHFEEKTTNSFATSGFHKIANIHVYSTAHVRIRHWKNYPYIYIYISCVPSLSSMWD